MRLSPAHSHISPGLRPGKLKMDKAQNERAVHCCSPVHLPPDRCHAAAFRCLYLASPLFDVAQVRTAATQSEQHTGTGQQWPSRRRHGCLHQYLPHPLPELGEALSVSSFRSPLRTAAKGRTSLECNGKSNLCSISHTHLRCRNIACQGQQAFQFASSDFVRTHTRMRSPSVQ